MNIKELHKKVCDEKKEIIKKIELAKAMEYSREYVGQLFKNDDKQISLDKIELTAKYFNIPIEKINNGQAKIIDKDCYDLPVRGEVNASMGYGITVYDESETGIYHISKKLAKDLMINENLSEIIFASGDSMYPTIEGGDSLLIDKSKTDIYDGRIYCVRIDGQLYAKRLQKIPPSTIVVVSDNTKYKTFEIDFSKEINYDFAVIGEVKWWGRIAR